MKDLFYCEADQTLFWVAGYTKDGNTHLVSEKIEDLKANSEEFKAVAGVEINQVMTMTVTRSRKYLNMRVFYATIPVDNVPLLAFRLGDNWSNMWEWIEY